MKPFFLLLGFCLVGSAQASSLNTVITLQGPRVYLRDLFDGAGVNAARVLGPGPGPGGRIVVEARQLKAIASQYDVDWRPVSSADRAVLEWPGRPLRREDALAAVRAALVARGAGPASHGGLPGLNPPHVPFSGTPAPLCTQPD